MPNETAGEKLLARRYRLVAPVGHGGMGTVWQAHDEVLGRDVAVKEVILPHGLTDEERSVQYKRTFREARTAARLGHPGVVTVYDVVEEDGRPWIIMELIRARSLDQVIKREGPLPVRRAAEIGRQMLAALHAAHEAGVLHRDVKPSNVLLGDGDRAVLTDFGIAVATGDATLTQTGLVMGSPAYIAPERARGKTAGPASDLWSLGVTLYAMVDGRSPFERPEPMASLVAIISDDPPPAPHAGALAPVIEGLLRKDPDERMSAPEAGMLLDEIVREESVDAQYTRPVPPPPEAGSQAPPEADELDRSHPAQRAQEIAAIGDGGSGDPLETATDPEEPADAAPTRATSQSPEPAATVLDEAGLRAGPPGGDTLPAGASPGTRSSTGAGGGRRGPGARVLIGVVVVVLLLAISVVAVMMNRDNEPDRKPGGALSVRVTSGPPTGGSSGSPTTARTASASASPSEESGDDPPEGFRRHRDRTGFSIVVPEDWNGPEREGTSVFFRSSDRGSYVQVDQTSDPSSSALRDWEELEAATRGSRFPGYDRIKLGPTGDQPPVPDTGDGDKSADWEFTWQGSSGRMHGLNRGFVAGGNGYAIFLVAPDSQWEETRSELEPVFRHFEPAD
ncbi:serine/threonine-protein kinase [Thermomonospora echinospora]|nr:serine/threonine-protein kinase [Thermomonospora echinospora]